MAKKVVVSDDGSDGNVKKKRGKCCSCCIAVLIFVLVILAAAFGVGWYFGNMFTRETLDMSLADTLGVMGDLYWANDKKVVTNPYDSNDINGFYKQIKRNILLKDDTAVDFDSALEKAVVRFLNSDGGGRDGAARLNASSAVSENGSDGPDDGMQESDGNDVMDIIVDMVADALKRENIDTDRLERYPAFDEYIFELNDRELAAFLNSVIGYALKNADKIEALKDVAPIMDLSKVISLKQVTFRNVTGETVSTLADVTVWIGLQDAAGSALKYYLNEAGFGWAGPLAGWLGNVILPENLYVTLGIPLDGDAHAEIKINDMTESERERAYKLVDKILEMNGDDQPQTLEGILDGLTEGIKPYLEAAAKNMDFGEVPSKGTLKIDLLDAVTKMASEGMEGDPLGKADFIYMLKALFSDPEDQLRSLEPYRYTDRYLIDGKEVYRPDGVDGQKPIDYERRFIEEIEDKYSVDFGDDAELKDVLAALGISPGGTSDSDAAEQKRLTDLIDAAKFNASLDKDIKDLELTVTDRMLAAALSTQMSAFTEGFPDMTATLDALTFVKKSGKDNMYAMLAVEADLSGMVGSFGDDNLVAQIAAGLMPERLLFTVTTDITRSLPAGVEHDKTEFILNSCEDTDRALDAITKLVPSFDMGALTESIETTLNDMLDGMYKMLDIRLVASTYECGEDGWTGESGAIVLPDIFTVVVDTTLTDENGRVVEPEQLKNVLRSLNDTSGVALGDGIAESYSAFIDSVVDKYYLASDVKIDTFDRLTEFLNEFDTAKIRVKGNDPHVKYLAYDTRSIEELKPVMTGAELGAFLTEKMGAGVAAYEIKSVVSAEDSLTIMLAIAVNDLLSEDVKFLVTADELYVTATVDMTEVNGSGDESDPFRYKVNVTINTMDEETFGAATDIISFLSPDFDIQSQVDEFGEILYTQLRSVNDSFVSSDGDVQKDFFRFTESGLVLDDYYTFLASKLSADTDAAPSELKKAVQGMYARSDTAELYNADNYVATDFLLNVKDGQTAWAADALPDSGTPYSDVEFNGYIKRAIEVGTNSVKSVQTAVLVADDVNAAALRDWARSRTVGLDDATDYMLVTFNMSMSDFMSSNNKDAYGLLPETVYATVVYGYVDGILTQKGMIFNDMPYAEFELLTKLMDLSSSSSDGINIDKIATKTSEAFGLLLAAGDVVFGGRTGNEGIGSITFTSSAA